jgi:hypothetical protein
MTFLALTAMLLKGEDVAISRDVLVSSRGKVNKFTSPIKNLWHKPSRIHGICPWMHDIIIHYPIMLFIKKHPRIFILFVN